MAGSLENRGKLRELIDKSQFLKLRNRYLLGKNTISYVYAITREEWKKMKEN